jgi:hypothetical protein
MWKALAVALAVAGLVPETAAAQFSLTNVRTTYGLLGLPRPNNDVLPGDILFVAFDIEGIKADDKSGEAQYTMGMELVDSKGKAVFKQDPRPAGGKLGLGGTRIPSFAHIIIGTDQPPGKYTLKLTVTDRAKVSKILTLDFMIKPVEFGLVRLQTSFTDYTNQVPAPPVGVAGQVMVVTFATTGMKRDAKKQLSIKTTMRVLDAKGTATKPLTFDIPKDLPEDARAEADKATVVPMWFYLPLNRAGKFTVELESVDENGKKKAKLTFPLTVLDPDSLKGK